ncbi:hypothetical protein AB0280_17500 [Pseudarthrobacter sp902506025]|uniref:hypothetical protein n=1 Tax=Pseudarthrobacter sp. 902506025 TaxID=3155291 RepID=UPI00344E1437
MAKQIKDKKSNIEAAEAVISPNRKYFLPLEGVTVEADDELEAATKAKQQKEAEVGDDII